MNQFGGCFRILSIDGGGVRGVIPARILQWFEESSSKPISQLFDLIVGTSTGGLITLGLGCPGVGTTPKYLASEILQFYQEHAEQIFKDSLARSLMTGKGLWASKYNRKTYDQILHRLFGDVKMSQSICPVVIPTYSLKMGSPNFFASSPYGQHWQKSDCLMRDVAAAASAAPIYFAPKVFKDTSGTTYVEVDAGIYANNPQAIGVAEAFQMNPGLLKENIFVVSIGTGSPRFCNPISKLANAGVFGWFVRANLIDIMLDAHSDWYTEETSILYPNTVRLQTTLPQDLGRMDDASRENLSGLLKVANNYVLKNEHRLFEILNKLESGSNKSMNQSMGEKNERVN